MAETLVLGSDTFGLTKDGYAGAGSDPNLLSAMNEVACSLVLEDIYPLKNHSEVIAKFRKAPKSLKIRPFSDSQHQR